MVGKSRDTLWRNIFEPIEKDPALAFLMPYVSYRQGAITATIMGTKVNVIGASDAKAESKIRGMTVGGAYGDELTVWPEDFFKQLLARMSPPAAQFFGTTNPDSPQHWLKVGYLDRLDVLTNWRRFHFVMDDNPGLTEQFKTDLKLEYSGLWYKRFILGMWVSAEGAIYEDWDEDTHVIPFSEMPRIQRVLAVGIDYGTTNATVAILLGITDERNTRGQPTPRLIAMDEWRYDSKKTGHRLSDAKLAARFHEWLLEEHAPFDLDITPEYIIVDPSAASFSEALAELKLTTWAADNGVKDGISDIATLLSQGHLIVTDRCKSLIEEAPGYVWDEKATFFGEDKPVKLNDHAMDAWRYSVRSTKNLWQPLMRTAYRHTT
jgi:PBSX family phage terminase large subunit